MKHFKSYLLALTFLSIFSFAAFAHTIDHESHEEVTTLIQDYLSHADLNTVKGSVIVFTNFIVSEHGENFSVDFMVTENDEVVVLSKNQDDEYYRVDNYNPDYMRQYSVPVSYIAI